MGSLITVCEAPRGGWFRECGKGSHRDFASGSGSKLRPHGSISMLCPRTDFLIKCSHLPGTIAVPPPPPRTPTGDLMGTQAVLSVVSCFHNASLRPGVLLSPFLALIWAQGPAEHSPWVLRALGGGRKSPPQLVHRPPSLHPCRGLLKASPVPKSRTTTIWPTASLLGQKTGKAPSRARVHIRRGSSRVRQPLQPSHLAGVGERVLPFHPEFPSG